MLNDLCDQLREVGRGIRRVDLICWRVDGAIERLTIGTAAPTNAVRHVFRLFNEKLDRINPGFGIEAMALHAVRTDLIGQAQSDMAAPVAKVDLAALIDRLSSHFGPSKICSFIPNESWLPEQAQKRAPMFSDIRAQAWPGDRPRPVRLLSKPLPIDVTAEVPDSPPAVIHWRGSQRRIAKAAGPERIEGEWWLRHEPPRDYYRLEDDKGRRYWVYRAGLYGQHNTPRWYLHGFFA